MGSVIVILIVCLLLMAVINSQMDACSSEEEYKMSIPNLLGLDKTFWCKPLSYGRKWKIGKKEQGEAFWGSSTFFVWLTDGWHLLKFIFNRINQFLILFLFFYAFDLKNILLFLLIYFAIGFFYGLTFEYIYSKFYKNFNRWKRT